MKFIQEELKKEGKVSGREGSSYGNAHQDSKELRPLTSERSESTPTMTMGCLMDYISVLRV